MPSRCRAKVPKFLEKWRGSHTYSGQKVAGWGLGGAQLSGRYWPGQGASHEGLSSKRGARAERQKGRSRPWTRAEREVSGQHLCKSAGTREIHTGAWLTQMLADEPEDQQQLPKGGPRTIPDIPMDLPQSPLTTGQVTPYSRGQRTPGRKLWLAFHQSLCPRNTARLTELSRTFNLH